MAAAHPVLDRDVLWVGARKADAPLTYWDARGKDVANVASRDPGGAFGALGDEVVRHTAEAWEVWDRHGVVFRLRRYDAADHPSYDVVGDDDEPIATFLCEGGILHEHVLVRDEAAAPVAEMQTRRHEHVVSELHGPPLASCRRVFEPAGGDAEGEVWRVEVAPESEPLDRRALVAAPLVCHLIGHPKRHIDPECMIGVALLITVPPVGAVVLAVERTADGLYWLKRRLV